MGCSYVRLCLELDSEEIRDTIVMLGEEEDHCFGRFPNCPDANRGLPECEACIGATQCILITQEQESMLSR